ncbi:dienelactone hydrolase family protein [Fontibacter flavus]|uniref:Dienelactone hydrolase family protein n=1 Tax=Fontibacter flavus TaxID=654838 RepID=A0ABV6FQQ4_9BACT
MEHLKIKVDNVLLDGDLSLPENPKGIIIFSHGSGSSRFSPRNNLVAQYLNKLGFGTFLFDLLTKEEDSDYQLRFDIPLLSERLIKVTNFLINVPSLAKIPCAYFGSSTGAASALIAASKLQDKIKAVVSRGGRPDLALHVLQKVKAPTLLIVGDLDTEVKELNQIAFEKIPAEKEIKIIEGATHLFEEPGKLELISQISGEWFQKFLISQKQTPNQSLTMRKV